MDPAFLLLLVFLVYSVLLGVCLARMRAINRELDLMKGVIAALGSVQRDSDCDREIASTTPVEITPELLKRLSVALEGDNG